MNCHFMQDSQSSGAIGGLGTGITSGLIDEMAWETLPDSKLMTSDLSLSEPHVCLDTNEALKEDPIYKTMCQSKVVQNDASKCILTTHVSSVSLSEVAAAREGSSYENLIVKVIEVKQVSDGAKVCYTGDTLTLEKAFQCSLISASVYVNILQKQKTCQDMIYRSTAENVPLFEPEQETEPCEVIRLILNCLSRNKSLTSERNNITLSSVCVCDGLSDHETTSGLLGEDSTAETSKPVGGLQYDDRMKVDVCVQCDLMSSSSTLVMLGNQCQFMGLVLPHSGEIQTALYDQQITTDDFTSRLFSNRQKIAALYIPENSEVVDITFAAQNGFIDSYTAEVLKSIELPDVFPDVDALKEKFSSWLMYKKLTLDGCYDAADYIKIENVLIPTEERHLFISYLMMNSYIDPKSGQRILILDKQMTKMVKLFLEDLISSENTEKNVSSLTLNVCDLSEQVDLETPLHAQINTQHTFYSHDFVSSVNVRIASDENTEFTCDPHCFVSSGNGAFTFDEDAYAGYKTLKQDPVEDFSDAIEPEDSEKSIFQNNINRTKSDEFCGNTLTIDAVDTDSDVLIIPTSLEMSVFPTLCSVKSTYVDLPSKICDSEASVKACCHALPRCDADSLCSESRNIDIKVTSILFSRDLVESENEQDHAIRLLKGQFEEGGILDVTSGRRYDLEEALKKGVVDETTVLRLLDLQSNEKEGLIGEEEGPMSVLNNAVSDGSISSNITFSTMEHQKLLRSDCTDSSLPISVDHNLHLIKLNEAENIQQPTDSEAAVTLLEEEDKKRGTSDCVTRGNVQDMSNYLHQSTSAVSSYGSLMSSPSSWSRVTAECVHHTDTSLLLTEDGFSQEIIDSMLTNGADVAHVVAENAVPSHPCSLNDRTCISDPETQPQCVFSTVHSCNSDSSHVDNHFYITGYSDGIKGKQTVCDSELDVSSPHFNVLFEEGRTGSDTSAVFCPLDSELSQSIDYSLPRDLVEGALMSVPKGDWSYDKNTTLDGGRTALHQQAALCSESIVESQNSEKQINNSTQLPEVSSENNTATNTFYHRYCDIENSNNSVSPETTNKDSLDSEHSGADDVDITIKRFSPERQHVDSFSDIEEMFVSIHEKEHGNINVTCPSSVSFSINSAQSETMRERLESDRIRLDVHFSENPQVNTSFQSDSSITSDVPSSNAVMTGVYEQGEMTTKGTNVSELKKAQTTESPVPVVQNTSQPLEKGGFHERDTPHELVERSRPNLHMDLLNQNTLSLNNKEKENPELILQEENVPRKIEQSDSPHIQLQLLQVLKAVSSSQDLSVLQEVMDTLNSALGGDSYEDQWHTLESIKEENSEGEDEGSADPSQSSAKAVACKVEEVKKKVRFILSQC